MNAEIVRIVSAACRSAGGEALLIDSSKALCEHLTKDGVAFTRLVDLGLQSEDLWAAGNVRSYTSVVVGKPRTARELYRILANVERLVLPKGLVLVAPYVTEDGPENRFEATEVFSGIFGDWERRLLPYGIVEMSKQEVAKPLTKRAIEDTTKPGTKKVVGLSLFNAKSSYWKYLPAFIRAHHTLFPGFELWIHHDEGIYEVEYGPTLHALEALGLVKLVFVPSRSGEGKCLRMLHRLMPAWDPEVRYVFSRDIDALPTWRDRCAVEEFIESAERGETEAHTIHDSISHCATMGGLCGYKASSLRQMFLSFDDFVRAAGYSDAKWAEHGADQEYLNSAITPNLNVFEHSVFVNMTDDGTTRILRQPTEWKGGRRSTRFESEIRSPKPTVKTEVPISAQATSDSLVGHMGAAGYDISAALAFYDEVCPVISKIKEAEKVGL